MNIIFVTNAFYPKIGGAEKAVANIARELNKLDHMVDIVTARNPITLPGLEKVNGLPVHRVPFYVYRDSLKSLIAMLLGMPISAAYLLYLALSRRPCIVHIQFIYHNAVCIELIRRILQMFGISVVVTFQGGDAPNIPQNYAKSNPSESNILNWTAKHLIGRADYLTAVSKDLNKNISTLAFCSKKKIETIYNGVDTDVFKPYNNFNENKGILSIGRLSHQKGFDIIIKAFSLIAPLFPEWNLNFAGDGELRSQLLGMVAELNLRNRVNFLGMIPENRLVSEINSCAFAVSGSRWEGFSLASLEIMACGKTLITTDTTGAREMIDHDNNGIIIPKENPIAMADAIKYLIMKPEVRKKMGKLARVHVQDHFSWNIIAKKYEIIYQKLLTNENS